MDQRTIQSLFDSAIRSDFAWHDNAAQLLRSASHILNSALQAKDAYYRIQNGLSRELNAEELEAISMFRQHEVGFFLVALAVENLLKGLWIARNQTSINEISHLKRDLGDHFGHDQVRIARECAFSISSDEEKLLSDFKMMTEWRGKYHVPLRVDEYRTCFSESPPSWLLFKESTAEDPWSPRVTTLIKRIVAATNESRANKPPEPMPLKRHGSS